MEPKDLIILAADQNIRAAMLSLAGRPQSLQIRLIECDVFVHPEHDPGCRLKSVAFLASFRAQYAHALVVFDREGYGKDVSSREEIESALERDLARSGWDDRARVVVIDPELENWVWTDSPHVEGELGWPPRQPTLRTWLREKGLWAEDRIKPPRPKEALEVVLRQVQKARSSSLYSRLAEKVSLARCTDCAFLKLKAVLREWFAERKP